MSDEFTRVIDFRGNHAVFANLVARSITMADLQEEGIGSPRCPLERGPARACSRRFFFAGLAPVSRDEAFNDPA